MLQTNKTLASRNGLFRAYIWPHVLLPKAFTAFPCHPDHIRTGPSLWGSFCFGQVRLVLHELMHCIFSHLQLSHTQFSWPFLASFPDLSLSLLQVSALVLGCPLAWSTRDLGFPFSSTHHMCSYFCAKDRNWGWMSPPYPQSLLQCLASIQWTTDICCMNMSLSWNRCLCWWYWSGKKSKGLKFSQG